MGGKKKSSPPAPVKTAEQIAQENVEAQIRSIPRASRAFFEAEADPTSGIIPRTQLQEQARRQTNPELFGLQQQLVESVLGQLRDPTGLTPEQQTAVDTRRQLALNRFQEAQRTRSNLGGGLFGGRTARAEEEGVGNLINQFVEEDIARQERERLNTQQIALALSNLFQGQQASPLNFINPVPSANVALQGDITRRAQDLSAQQAEINRQAALQSALFQAIGTAGGAALGGL